MRKAARGVGIGIVALAVVVVLIVLLFQQQKQNKQIACAYRSGTVVSGNCVTSTTRN